MAYESKPLKRQKVRYNSANDDNLLTYQLDVDGEKVTPSSATITFYRSGSTTAIASAAAMTVDGTLLTYALDTTTTSSYPVESGYRADIVVTVGAVTHDRHIIFDVAKYLLNIGLTRDQLLDRDSNILGAEHGGDEQMPGLINAVRDELQLLLETKAIQDEQLFETMIIDSSRLAIPARLKVLWHFYETKDAEIAESYERQWRTMWRAFLGGIKYDTSGDGSEETEQKAIVQQRLVM